MLRYQLAHSEESPKLDSFVSVSPTFSNLSHSRESLFAVGSNDLLIAI